MSGKGSGPVSTFSFGDLPLLGFLVCLRFFYWYFLAGRYSVSTLPVERDLALSYRSFND